MLSRTLLNTLKPHLSRHVVKSTRGQIRTSQQISVYCYHCTKMMPSYTSTVSINSSKYPVIDLRSDTISRPSPEMRQAMFEAEVGDDVYLDDPTVIKLEQLAAKMFNKEAGIFVTSGTMGNLIAVMGHCDRRGCEMICGDESHTFLYEQGGPAQVAGVHTRTIPNLPDGTFDLGLVEKALRGDDIHSPITGLIVVENTHNMCGGKALPLEWLEQLGELAEKHSIPVHMDGARVFNAAVHLGVPVSVITKHCKTVQFCLSKSLGCPIGSLLVGPKDFIVKARRLRKVLGGAMRQVGVLAAPGLVALKSMIDRLADDHRRTREIAQAIEDAKCDFMKVDVPGLHTNILMIHLNPSILTATDFCSKLAQVSDVEAQKLKDDAVVVRISPKTTDVVRLVVYYEITDEDVRRVIKKIQYIISSIQG